MGLTPSFNTGFQCISKKIRQSYQIKDEPIFIDKNKLILSREVESTSLDKINYIINSPVFDIIINIISINNINFYIYGCKNLKEIKNKDKDILNLMKFGVIMSVDMIISKIDIFHSIFIDLYNSIIDAELKYKIYNKFFMIDFLKVIKKCSSNLSIFKFKNLVNDIKRRTFFNGKLKQLNNNILIIINCFNKSVIELFDYDFTVDSFKFYSLIYTLCRIKLAILQVKKIETINEEECCIDNF